MEHGHTSALPEFDRDVRCLPSYRRATATRREHGPRCPQPGCDGCGQCYSLVEFPPDRTSRAIPPREGSSAMEISQLEFTIAWASIVGTTLVTLFGGAAFLCREMRRGFDRLGRKLDRLAEQLGDLQISDAYREPSQTQSTVAGRPTALVEQSSHRGSSRHCSGNEQPGPRITTLSVAGAILIAVLAALGFLNRQKGRGQPTLGPADAGCGIE